MTYSIEELDAKIADAQARFDDAQSKKNAADAVVTEQETEMFRVQGEYRVLNQMRELAVQAEQAAPADPALIIEAKPKKETK